MAISPATHAQCASTFSKFATPKLPLDFREMSRKNLQSDTKDLQISWKNLQSDAKEFFGSSRKILQSDRN